MEEPDPSAAAVVDDYSHISDALGHPVPAKIVRTDDGRCITCRLAFKDPDPRVAVLLNIISGEEAAAVIEAGLRRARNEFALERQPTVGSLSCSCPEIASQPRGRPRNNRRPHLVVMRRAAPSPLRRHDMRAAGAGHWLRGGHVRDGAVRALQRVAGVRCRVDAMAVAAAHSSRYCKVPSAQRLVPSRGAGLR